MFSTLEILGLSALLAAVLAAGFLIQRLDTAISREEALPTADAAPEHEPSAGQRPARSGERAKRRKRAR